MNLAEVVDIKFENAYVHIAKCKKNYELMNMFTSAVLGCGN
jgi:hypothetical protein